MHKSINKDESAVLISVIVAVYNGAATLQNTIDSVIGQAYSNIELIIIDGGSKDGTKDIIDLNDDVISYWVSENDRGIYHAWNKGIAQANGEYICFLGADDTFADSSSVGALVGVALDGKRKDLVSSKVVLVDRFGANIATKGEPWNWGKMKRWMCVAHPGMLHHRSLFLKFGCFDEKFGIAGDYEFLLRAGSKVNAGFLDGTAVLMGAYGVSNQNEIQALKETRGIQSKHEEIGVVRAYFQYFLAALKVPVRRFLWKG